MSYIDGFVVPAPSNKKEEYRAVDAKHADLQIVDSYIRWYNKKRIKISLD
jgi:uncharacterized protein YbaA (DUF1428 family)